MARSSREFLTEFRSVGGTNWLSVATASLTAVLELYG